MVVSALEWLNKNREWVFSGVGVAAIMMLIAVIRWFVRRPLQAPQQPAIASQQNSQVVNLTITSPPLFSTPTGSGAPHAPQPIAPGSVTGEPLQILLFLRDGSGARTVTAGAITAALRIPHARVEFHLDTLHAAKLVDFALSLGRSAGVFLTAEGLRYLSQSGLLE